MSIYRKYLVCYDVADNKVRTKLFDYLKDLGLIPIQKSAFWGELNAAEFRAMKRRAHKSLDPETDRMFWIVTQLDEHKLKEGIGYNDFLFIEADGHHVV